ncbi:hypothetical protein FJR48_06930 [Sulfurimonas lithotrophica]|uniref:HPt domain-containing protein n=1 Tax=Sulfurimonas lithotrophica TaxID=2590022 RepID=A0A5P8P1L6_9BACT|nr:hypothetical protein [Sulfurimonas lithotrophica]QFR49477.1 hypothetical protein FJR48_06930 [Sulfurimonas lithotrophica]
MLNKVEIDDTISKEDNIASILELAKSVCDNVFRDKETSFRIPYIYDYSIPANELGLDKKLIIQLIEDYISQIFKTYNMFHDSLENISKTIGSEKELKKLELKNLAHKNLGVARNLRIEDAQVLLTDLMNKHDDLEHLKRCIEALMACAFKLNPSYAYDVLKLKKVKDSL